MSEEAKKRKAQYVAEYQRKTYTNISFKVRTIEDKDIIDVLSNVSNKSEYIKKLIRDDQKR